MYHSVCQRFVKQKKPNDAIALLHSGSLNLLKYGQIGSAADLAGRMLDLYESEGVELSDASKARVVEIFQAFPVQEENTYLTDFVRAAIKWTSKHGNCPTGDPQLQHIVGSKFFKEKEYYDAESHLVYGTNDSAKALGHLAFEWSQQGYCTDKGYFIARSALSLLAQKKLHKAHIAFETYAKSVQSQTPSEATTAPFRPTTDPAGSPAQQVPVFSHRLATFVSLLLFVIQRDSLDQFTILRAEYRTALDIDGYLHALVDKIAAVWFNLGPKQQPNIIEDLMKSLFAGPPPPPAAGRSRQAVTGLD
ncbi:hypothetical protein DFJ73DRAFT_838950 [Zopfochytrium polystomum]|nr:hypothetical protein DFJ73DRAFT_838950 [Zopfochytrium polystomum]